MDRSSNEKPPYAEKRCSRRDCVQMTLIRESDGRPVCETCMAKEWPAFGAWLEAGRPLTGKPRLVGGVLDVGGVMARLTESDPARVADALRYAVTVIESYEADIRNSEWAGVNLVEKGFCQGSIYLDALPRIMRILDGRSTSGVA